ncbi:hypothetical protein AVEN_204699-1 [Araneus ventricosus]|uniref:Uncharacterized protein n=1 Tax=Araneus ventricosus TaxID=182803 RepID=A0A4Y2GIV4_ARAVE|nr:hypothetical protein AVEN_204699-1 [Araneus ventricosus]
MPTWPCGLRRLPIAPAYRIAGSNPRQELEVSSHSTSYKRKKTDMYLPELIEGCNRWQRYGTYRTLANEKTKLHSVLLSAAGKVLSTEVFINIVVKGRGRDP